MTQTFPQSSQPQAGRYARVPGVSHEVLAPLVRLEMLLEKFTGKEPVAAPAHAWSAFSGLPADKQLEIARGWTAQADFIQGAIERDIHHCDEKRMLNYAMGTMNLLADSGLFTIIDESDVMEIIGPDCVQTYRSFSYFTLCNYSLVELAAYPFYELYERSSRVMETLMQRAGPILEGKSNSVLLDDVPDYTIRETMTEEGCVYRMRERAYLRLISALTGENYVLSVKKVTQLATPAKQKDLAYL